MIARSQKAFTLIELLIVVAMIAILCAATINFIIIPPRESAWATTDMENEGGLQLFFTKLVTDAHNATSMTLAAPQNALFLHGATGSESAVYYLDRQQRLRRALLPPGEAVAALRDGEAWKENVSSIKFTENVGGFKVEPAGGGLWRVGVSFKLRDPLHPTLDRAMELAIGDPTAAASTPPPRSK